MPAKKGDTMRAFVALDLDTTSRRRVARVADRLRMGSGAPSAAWTPPEKMHVTLKFAGELPAEAVVPLGRGLAALADDKSRPQPCPFCLAAFPSAEDARVIVAELRDASGVLVKLAERVDRLVAKHLSKGAARKDDHPFRPHVTLARLKRPYDARRWLRPELAAGAGECRMTTLTLYRSELGEQGATYVPLARFDFEAVGV